MNLMTLLRLQVSYRRKRSSPLLRDILLICLGGVAGLVGFASARLPVLLLAVPLLWSFARSRLAAFGVFFAYNLAVSRGLFRGAAVFLFETHTATEAAMLWLLMALGVSLPFLIFWSPDRHRKAVCLIAAFAAAYFLPPISLIGVANPLMAAGCVFPGWGFWGMLTMLSLFYLCVLFRKFAFVLLCFVFLVSLMSFCTVKDSPASPNFLAVSTSFGRLGSGSFSFQDDYRRARMVFADLEKRRVRESEAQWLVLPETIAGRLNATGMRLWTNELRSLLREDQGIFFGAEIPSDKGNKYDNVIVYLDNCGVQIVPQRIPVPYSMYRGPFAKNGANLHFFDDGIIALPDGKKAAIVICYEAFLTWPYVLSMLYKPDMIICASNLWWCKDTSLPEIQSTMLRLWAVLFDKPVLRAVNQ